MTLQVTSISPGDLWAQLGTIPDFKGIKRAEFDRLIKHMLKTNYLYLTGGLLAIGIRKSLRAEEFHGSICGI